MTDTSKDAVETFIQTVMKEAVLSEGLPRTSEDTEYAYETIALLRALAAKLAEVTAENRELALQIISSDGQAIDAYAAQQAAEAMLPAAYRAGVGAGAKRAHVYLAEAKLPLEQRSEGAHLGLYDAIHALPTPTIEQLKEMLKDTTND